MCEQHCADRILRYAGLQLVELADA